MEFVIVGFAVYYLTSVLLYDPDDIGPFPAKDTYIVQTIGGDVQRKPVDLFDWFRYLFFAYRIEQDSNGQAVWYVRPYAMMVWSCAKCLSFWIAILIFAVHYFVPQFPLEIIAFAGVTTFLARFSQ